MKAISRTEANPRAGSNMTGVRQRKCACGGTPGPTGECESCRKKREAREGTLQRKASSLESVGEVPPIVHEVLQSTGQPLEKDTRGFMESRFGHDFSRVRIHTDSKAIQSARAVNALAYTVGQEIVFETGQYAPKTNAGRRLLGHELAHTLQQLSGAGSNALTLSRDTSAEHEADRAAQEVDGSRAVPLPRIATSNALMRQPSPVDQTAQSIIDAASDQQRELRLRAIDVVQRIVNQYFAADATKISSIVFDERDPGLSTTYQGTGQSTTGIIHVGHSFVEQTTRVGFARRVAQVGHEIEHIDQHRSGMAGQGRQDEREYRAFYHEALFVERPGTGRIQHATRVNLIDAALGYYYCLDSSLQQQFANQQQELVDRRQTEVSASGRTFGPAPTSCQRQAGSGPAPQGSQGSASPASSGATPTATGTAQSASPQPQVTVQIPLSPTNFQLPFSGSTSPSTGHNNYLDQAWQPNAAVGIVHSWRRNARGQGWDLGGFLQGGLTYALGQPPTTATGRPRSVTGIGLQGYVQPSLVVFSIDLGGERSFQGSVFAQAGGGFLISDIPGLQGWSINGQLGPQLTVDLVPNRLQLVGAGSVGYAVNFPSQPLPGDSSAQGSPFWGFNVGIQILFPVSYHSRSPATR